MTKEKNNLQANASLQRNNTYMIKKRDMVSGVFPLTGELQETF